MYSRANRAAALALAGMLAAGSISDGINPVHTVQAAEQTKEVAVDAAVQEQTDEIKEEIKYERIDISTPEEFAAFASQCYIDAWSKNKYVSLRADIDLSGTQMKLVPVFNGVFDGVGHTISGFDYMGDGYVVGLFRYVGRDGLIQNLTVKGTVDLDLLGKSVKIIIADTKTGGVYNTVYGDAPPVTVGNIEYHRRHRGHQ